MELSTLRNGILCHGAVYGDLPFHLNLITSFSNGCNSKRQSLFDFVTPFFAHEKLSYPIIPDFLSSAVYGSFNVYIRYVVTIPSYFLFLSLFIVFPKLIFEFTKRRNASLIAPWLFLLSGGLGFRYYINQSIRKEEISDYVYHLGTQNHLYWFHMLIHILLPQRASLFSLPISYSIMLLLINKNVKRIQKFVLIGILAGCLPQVSGHTLISVFLFSAAFCLLNCSKFILQYIIYALVSAFLVIPQCIPYMSRVKSHFFQVNALWNNTEEKFIGNNILSFWVNSLGMLFVLSTIIGPFFLNNVQLKTYIPALFVFIISNFVQFQPWVMDNTKVFNATWFPIAIATASNVIVRLFKTRFRIISYLLIVLCCLSGALAIYSFHFYYSVFWHDIQEAHDLTQELLNISGYRDVFAVYSDHSSPALTLAGRQALFGYIGWIKSHGIDYINRSELQNRLFINPEHPKIKDVHFVIITKWHNESTVFRPRNIASHWYLAIDTKQYSVWKRI